VKSSDVGSSSRAEIVEVFNTLDADLDRLCELGFDVFVSDLIRMASHANHHLAVFHNGKALALYLTSGCHPCAANPVVCQWMFRLCILDRVPGQVVRILPGCGRILGPDGLAERALAGGGVEEQAQQVGDGRRTVTNQQLA
jgi:hypothetical protein